LVDRFDFLLPEAKKKPKRGEKQMITIAEIFFWPVLDDDDGVDDYENDGNRK
jgi:hypothetical protein